MALLILPAIAISLAAILAQPRAGGVAAAGPKSKPNVILLVTDDQTLQEMSGLPQASALIGGQGATFNRAYISYPLCCPARASILSGEYMHNHNVRGNSPPTGSWSRFHDLGTEARDLPTWLQAAGYYDVQIGKYLNGYGGAPPPTPPGWNEWYGKLSEYDESAPGGKIYYDYRLREDPPPKGGVPCPSGDPAGPGKPFTCHYGEAPSDYQTDVIREKAVEAIHRLSGPSAGQQPFFLNIDFNAPHPPYVAAPKYAGSEAATPIAEPAGTNEPNMTDKPWFLRRLPKLGAGKLALITQRRRIRLEMLHSVDDAIASIVQTLAADGQLDNTYLLFTSDNGYFNGEHRIRQGKYLPHEPSSHVPLMIRGPGIPAGSVSDELVSNVDIASTVAEAAGVAPALPQDGRSMLPFARQAGLRSARPILLEGDTGPSIDDEGIEGPSAQDPALRRYAKRVHRQKKKLRHRCRKLKRRNRRRALLCYRRGVRNIEQEPVDKAYKLKAPAYRGIRTDRYALFLYSTGEVELYDMWTDPDQLKSVAKNRRYRRVRSQLLGELDKLARCSGASCSAAVAPDPVPATKLWLRCRSRRFRLAAKSKCRRARTRARARAHAQARARRRLHA